MNKTRLINIYITKYVKNRGVFLLERALSHEERIRRAEEIYRRRREESPYSRKASIYRREEKEEKNFYLFKKMFLQIAICLVIYFIFYLIQNSNYIFSDDVLEKTKQILSYDIDIVSLYEQTSQFFSEQIKGLTPSKEENKEEQVNNTTEAPNQEGEAHKENNEEGKDIDKENIGGKDESKENIAKENTSEETKSNEQIGKESGNRKEENQENGIRIGALAGKNGTIEQDETTDGIGGAELEEGALEGNKVASEELPPMTDEEYVKTNFSFIKPVEGIVSSEFGIRDVANPIVSKNHSGIDIAANTGTVIKASMEGTVSVSSTYGDYGYHIKITNNDVSTLYAHCSKLYVKEGDVISQGQEIAEVGSTGKSTGPHLHFEIIRNDNYLNPRDILEF